MTVKRHPLHKYSSVLLKEHLKHVDAISAISSLWRGCCFTPRMEYVIAHQDDHYLSLTDMETLNVETDHSAKYTA